MQILADFIIKLMIGVLMNRFLIIGLALLFMAQCSKKSEGTLLDDIRRRGVLRVGVSVFIPWVMNNKSGRLIGFEIDVANELSRDLGVRVEFVNTRWSGIIPALQRGEFDLIIGGMTVTSDRKKSVDFSEPYNYGGMSMVANSRLSHGYRSVEEFNSRNIIIGTRLGSTAVDAVLKKMPYAQLRFYDDEHMAVRDLLAGRIYALVASSPFPEFQAKKFSDRLYLPLSDTFTREPAGIAMRKDEEKLKRFLNDWIKRKWADGFLVERKNYWFKSDEWGREVF